MSIQMRPAVVLLLLAVTVGLCGCLRGVDAKLRDRRNALIGYKEKIARLCVDRSAKCAGWADDGQCVSNKAFMFSTCRKSCTNCTLPPALGPGSLAGWDDEKAVVIQTKVGSIRIQLKYDISPIAAAYAMKVAKEGICQNCRFYRSEGIPEPGAIDNFGGPGPPYALVQGSLSSPGFEPLKKEGAPLAERGMACIIGDGPDFFIAVGPHPEWGNAHTVFGTVDEESMEVADKITQLPTLQQTWGETHVTVLVEELPFTIVPATRVSSSSTTTATE